jgi:hypothetical protein
MTTNLVGPWRKSSYSGANGNCLEIAPTADGAAIRNSNRPEDGVILYTKAELDAFLKGAKDGEFDDLV